MKYIEGAFERLQDLIEELWPETAKEWAVAIIMYIMLIALLVIAGYVSELYDAAILLAETAVE